MARRMSRLGAVTAALAFVAARSLTAATGAQAGQLDGPAANGPAVIVIEPVDPQPVVAGHEGDVLLRVSVAMPAAKTPTAKVAKKTVGVKKSTKKVASKGAKPRGRR
jgi:hypothetical protein